MEKSVIHNEDKPLLDSTRTKVTEEKTTAPDLDFRWWKNLPVEWAREVGVSTKKNVFDPIAEFTKADDNDVYPLSIHFSKVQKSGMTAIRICAFLLCFYAFAPHDLYI